MYVITFDLDMENLRATYHNDSYTNAYTEIRMLQIEDNNDLTPAIERATGKKKPPAALDRAA